MSPRKVQRSFTAVLIYLFLLGALATYFMPMVRVRVAGFGERAWSAWDMTRNVPAWVKPQKKKNTWIKPDDFMEVVRKLSQLQPKQAPGARDRMVFILGVLVPVSLLAAYALMLLAFLAFTFLPKPVGFRFLTGSAALSALYGLVGALYLGKISQNAFQDAMQRAGSGLFAPIAKSFVRALTVHPDVSLYALVSFCFLAFLAAGLRKS